MKIYKGHTTHKIRKTDKNKEIILWINHVTADLTHIHNKNLKKKNYLENVSFETMTPTTI